MRPEYWQQRWREGRTGWHDTTVPDSLIKFWPRLGIPTGTRVLVPLCGKSLAMAWLASQGLRVLGVDVSQLAIEQFFAEHELTPEKRQGRHTAYVAGDVEIIHANVLETDTAVLQQCHAFYDRAAIIAQPAAERQRYADHVYAALPSGCTGLMVTLDYSQAEMEGPPFSVDAAELRSLFGGEWDIAQLERRDVLVEQPNFRAQGLSNLHGGLYRLRRH